MWVHVLSASGLAFAVVVLTVVSYVDIEPWSAV